MSKVVAIMSMSLDGHVADLNDSVADVTVGSLAAHPAPGSEYLHAVGRGVQRIYRNTRKLGPHE